MVKKFVVQNLSGAFNYDLSFYDDLNILTGRNGAGKTTVMKLLWFMISGNLERIEPEIRFDYVYLETTDFAIEATRSGDSQRTIYTWKFTNRPGERLVDIPPSLSPQARPLGRNRPEIPFDDLAEGRARVRSIDADGDYLNRLVVRGSSGSLFFPTFRRIEGGFGIEREKLATEGPLGVEGALVNLSRRLSVNKHRFIAAISTADISEELISRYAAISQNINRNHSELSKEIIGQIGHYSLGHKSEANAVQVLEAIEKAVVANDAKQAELLRPFDALSELTAEVFRHRGIKVSKDLALGQAEEAIASEVLSAGEKQMLSFLAYNAFTRDSVVFIDEPETSLHVDWQRILFPTLLSQGVNNQFIIATHSPFVYTKYEDKELILNEDRGF